MIASENAHDPTQRMPFDDLADEDESQLAQIILMQLTPEYQEALRHHFCAAELEEQRVMMSRMLGLLTKVVSFACFPVNPSKLWGMIYALDLPFHEGRSISDTARQLGISRANISGYARDFLTSTGMPPSRWMRSEETVERSKDARESLLG